MVGVKGVGGIPEPTPERPANVRSRKPTDVKADETQDGVQISTEARKAAEVDRLLALSSGEQEVRPERVAAAKENLAKGEYKLPNVVAQVARRILEQMDFS